MKSNKCHATFECPSYTDKRDILSSIALAFHYKTEPVCIENDHTEVETFINEHAKQIIKVNKSYNSNIARIHTGLAPITLRIWMTVIKYWRRTVTGTENTLLNATYKCAKSLDTKWFQGIQHILETHGMYDLWLDPTTINNKACIRYIRQRLNDIEEQNKNRNRESKKGGLYIIGSLDLAIPLKKNVQSRQLLFDVISKIPHSYCFVIIKYCNSAFYLHKSRILQPNISESRNPANLRDFNKYCKILSNVRQTIYCL